MKCMQCGSTMKTRRETYLYDRDGIQVTLENVPVHRCARCGDFEVEIPHIQELHQMLVDRLVRKPARLAHSEVRFLRKSLGWSSADLARHVGVDGATVSRWETGKQRMGPVAERLFRLLVSVSTPIEDYSLEDLAALTDDADPPLLRFRRSKSGWKSIAA